MKKVAIIDLGSNSVRVCVFQTENNHNKVIFIDRDQVMLGKDMTSDNMLDNAAIERAVNSIIEYKKLFDDLNVEHIFAVATAAVRKAANKDYFINYLKEKTGITLNVIDGKDEARYDYLAINKSFNLSDYLIMDIGGGSSEIIGVKAGKLTDWTSIPLASRNITEMYLNPETDLSVEFAEKEVFKIFSETDWLKAYKNFPIICIGGSFKAIGKSVAEKFGKEFTSEFSTDCCEIFELYQTVKTLSIPDRIELIGKSKGDIILGGMMPFVSVAKIIAPPKIYFTPKGVTDGIICELSETYK